MNFELQRGNLRARPLLLAAEEGVEGHVGDLADLEPDAGNVTNSVTFTSESTDKDLVVLLNEVQTAVIGDKSSDLLAVLDQLYTHALSMDMEGELGSEESQIIQPIMRKAWQDSDDYLMAELGCLASTPTFSRTIP